MDQLLERTAVSFKIIFVGFNFAYLYWTTLSVAYIVIYTHNVVYSAV